MGKSEVVEDATHRALALLLRRPVTTQITLLGVHFWLVDGNHQFDARPDFLHYALSKSYKILNIYPSLETTLLSKPNWQCEVKQRHNRLDSPPPTSGNHRCVVLDSLNIPDILTWLHSGPFDTEAIGVHVELGQ